ncbi:MAG: polyprenyl synthetase family protein [Nitrospiria bacterium]
MGLVWSTYKKSLDDVEGQILKGLDSKINLVNDIATYILNSGGKRIRPLFLMISSELAGKDVKKEHLLLGAGLIEYIHTATLLHDDVLDNADVRRGSATARVKWGNQPSILVGDYLYTLAVCQAVVMENHEVNHLLSRTCRSMTEGETLQFYHNKDFNLEEETYFKIVEYKTASLISTSCRLGAIIAQGSEEAKESLSSYGRHIGIAFQVADDTLDYIADRKRLGKSLGEDLKGGKITLPLIHLLQHCDEEEKKNLERLIGGATIQEEDLKLVTDLMRRYGSIDYANKKAQDFVNLAKEELNRFDDSAQRQALITMADYVIERDH